MKNSDGPRCDTQQASVEEDEEACARVDLIARQQCDVFHAKIECKPAIQMYYDSSSSWKRTSWVPRDGPFFVVRRNVRHQRQIFHKTAGLMEHLFASKIP